MSRKIEKEIVFSKLGSVFEEIPKDKELSMEKIAKRGGPTVRTQTRIRNSKAQPSFYTVWKMAEATDSNVAIYVMRMDHDIAEETLRYFMSLAIEGKFQIEDPDTVMLVQKFNEKIISNLLKSKPKKL